jgi:hypothetical protein
MEQRMTILETEFRTELKHLATKADLKALEIRLGGLMLVVGGLIVAVLRLWE